MRTSQAIIWLWLMPMVFFVSTSNLDEYDCVTESASVNRSYPVPDVAIEFTTAPVDKEFIVSFKGYYSGTARQKYITSALKNVKDISWRLVSRNNPASDYPSDFSLIQVG
jgi:hypothetical protein